MPTVASLKSLLIAQIAPGNPEEFLRLLTEADLRLLQWGKWIWCKGRTTLTPADGIVTLPASFYSIIGAQLNGLPVTIWGQEYEFVPGGIGEVEVGDEGSGGYRLIDAGINETSGLREYKVAGHLPNGAQIEAFCHYAPATLYDPDIVDSDTPEDAVTVTRCPDVAALKNAMLGILLEESGSDAKFTSYHFTKALQGLDDREKSQRGGAQAVVNVRPSGQGIRKIQSFR